MLDKIPSGTPLLESDVLKTFIGIAESGSFTRTAAQIFRTTAAVSQQIRRLEETLGSSLFLREHRRVRLTPDGELLLGYARRLLQLNEEAVAHFLTPRLAGTVRFGSAFDIGVGALPELLAQFALSHPAVQVAVSVGRSNELLERLDAGDLDLILINSGTAIEDSRGEIISSEPLVWVGRDGGLAVKRDPLPLALASHGCAWRRAALDGLERSGRDYRIAYTSEQCAGQEAAVLADLAIAAFPASLVKPPLRRLSQQEHGLPALGNCHIKRLCASNLSEASEALARLAALSYGIQG
jgi:DNA-binding transcriptional LysR family regulator